MSVNYSCVSFNGLHFVLKVKHTLELHENLMYYSISHWLSLRHHFKQLDKIYLLNLEWSVSVELKICSYYLCPDFLNYVSFCLLSWSLWPSWPLPCTKKLTSDMDGQDRFPLTPNSRIVMTVSMITIMLLLNHSSSPHSQRFDFVREGAGSGWQLRHPHSIQQASDTRHLVQAPIIWLVSFLVCHFITMSILFN